MTIGEFLDAAIAIADKTEVISVDAEGWRYSTGSREISYRVYSEPASRMFHGSTPEEALAQFRQAKGKSVPDGSLELSTKEDKA